MRELSSDLTPFVTATTSAIQNSTSATRFWWIVHSARTQRTTNAKVRSSHGRSLTIFTGHPPDAGYATTTRCLPFRIPAQTRVPFRSGIGKWGGGGLGRGRRGEYPVLGTPNVSCSCLLLRSRRRCWSRAWCLTCGRCRPPDVASLLGIRDSARSAQAPPSTA